MAFALGPVSCKKLLQIQYKNRFHHFEIVEADRGCFVNEENDAHPKFVPVDFGKIQEAYDKEININLQAWKITRMIRSCLFFYF